MFGNAISHLSWTPPGREKQLNIAASYSTLSVNHCPPVSSVNPQWEHISADFLLGSRTTSSRAELPWGAHAPHVSLYIGLHALWNICMCQIWSLKVKGLCLIHKHHILPRVMSSWWFTCVPEKGPPSSLFGKCGYNRELLGHKDNGLPSKGWAFSHPPPPPMKNAQEPKQHWGWGRNGEKSEGQKESTRRSNINLWPPCDKDIH